MTGAAKIFKDGDRDCRKRKKVPETFVPCKGYKTIVACLVDDVVFSNTLTVPPLSHQP